MASTRSVDLGIGASALALGAVFALLLAGVELIAQWFYLFAWIPTLALLDLVVVRLGGAPLMLGRPREAVRTIWWSAIIWLVFEAFNLRLKAWYYVSVPREMWLRWPGSILAFGTVVPIVLLPERVLDRLGLWSRLSGPVVRIGPRDVTMAMALGTVVLAAVLAAPALLHPLIWGGVFLLADPVLFRVRPEVSLIGEVSQGRWGRVARLLVGGLCAGLLWEAFNIGARAKWIYTVPFLEDLKLFEMPLLGFMGFPLFALEVWSMYHLAVFLAGRVKIAVPSVIFAVLALAGMDHWTVSSTIPRLKDLPGLDADAGRQLAQAGLTTVYRLAATPLDSVVERSGLSEDAVAPAYETARLAALRGIGVVHAEALAAAGYPSVESLAAADADEVWRAVGGGPRPTAAEVRVWVRAARKAAAP